MEENLIEKLRQKKAEIVSRFGSDKLDMSKLEGVESLEELKDAKQFLKEEEKKEPEEEDEQATYKGDDSFFKLEENEDGSFTARGSNGTIIKAPDFKALNHKVLSFIKENDLKRGREPYVAFRSPDEDKKSIFAKSAILEHGITIGRTSTLPEDTAFWKDLKNEYLQDKNHTQEQWNKMTRFVPDKIMGRTKEESEKNQKLIRDLDAKKKQSEQTRTVQPPKIPQKNNGNMLEEMLRRRQRGA